jgi:hypothetical protein
MFIGEGKINQRQKKWKLEGFVEKSINIWSKLIQSINLSYFREGSNETKRNR